MLGMKIFSKDRTPRGMEMYLRIGEVAKKLRVSAKTLRRWERLRKFIPESRHPLNNYRLYSVEQVEALLRKIGENHGPR